MTYWRDGKRYDTPPKCSNKDCPQCRNQFPKDPNQLSIDSEGFIPEVFEEKEEDGNEGSKNTQEG
jgi:hypothetical protein